MLKLASDILDIVKTDIFADIAPGDITIQLPPKADLGDFAIGCFILAKKLSIAPNIAAERIASAFAAHSDLFEKIEITGPYVNITLTPSYITKRLAGLSVAPLSPKNETILVDYFSANIGKPLHIGHLCSPSIGQSLINAHKYLGYTTIGDNHLGDWGGIFGKLITAYKKFGSPEELEKDAVEHLFQLYVKITALCEADEAIEAECREEFRKLASEDPENMRLWKEFTAHSLAILDVFAASMDVYPNYAIGESFYEGLSLEKIGNHPDLVYNMRDIVRELIEKKIATQNEDGSVGVEFKEESKIPSCMLAKRDGTHGYLASDLAAVKYRLTNGWNPVKLVYCVDNRQALHLKQVFAIAKLAWPELTKDVEFHHAANGFIKLKEWVMSTRKGIIVRLQDLFDEAFLRTKAIIESKGAHLGDEDFRAIAVGAVKYSYLMQDLDRDIVFDWDKALSLEGHSGPYIQYAHVRAKNLISKAQEAGIVFKNAESPKNLSLHDRMLFAELTRFQWAVEMTAAKCKPHHLALYAYDLATKFSSFYVHAPKLLEESDVLLRDFRLTLVEKTRDTLAKAFEILAIRMPKEM